MYIFLICCVYVGGDINQKNVMEDMQTIIIKLTIILHIVVFLNKSNPPFYV